MTKKNPKFDARNLRCSICGTTRGLIHKYGLHICRKCFRENARSIGFRIYS
ncbi:MAG: 30S ribosomal protein S14 [Candidatus Altiarchaeales archaeon]|nr:MAG: 30S ribosomal protein S14 [Candidatus Altiarchaeales archaeon]